MNYYRKIRDSLDMTREEVCSEASALGYPFETSRLGRIETNESNPDPVEILYLSQVYKMPELCSYFCAHDCDIGKKYVPEIKHKDLSQIILEMLSSLNTIKTKQERLIDIAADCKISDDEIPDFIYIQNELEKISVTVETLQLWVEKTLMHGNIDIEKYNKLKNQK